MLASEGGHDSCLQLLIAAGANLEHQTEVHVCKFLRLIDRKGYCVVCWGGVGWGRG